MKNKNYFYILFVIIVFFFLVCYQFWTAVNFDNIKYVKIGDVKIKVELAITPEARAQGLSGRPSLSENEGVLFVFDKPDKYSFWMKNMNFPIDIIWIGPARPPGWSGAGGEDMKIVYIKKKALPELYPEQYGPDKDAKYVLEVVAGFSDKNNIKVGDKVEVFSYPSRVTLWINNN